MSSSPLFEGLSLEQPSILSISFESDPSASLGVKLCNHDNELTNEMFLPGYASVGGMLEGPTLAKTSGVKVGDFIIAINGEGFRRFPPDFQDVDLINLESPSKKNDNDVSDEDNDSDNEEEEDVKKKRELKGRVIQSTKAGDVYTQLLNKIREIKSLQSSTNPLVISMERYMWDSRVHSWSRFLSARSGNVPAAMTMIQAHERWRNEFFPIDLTQTSLQRLLKCHAVSEIDVASANNNNTEENNCDGGEGDTPAPVVYIDFAKLQSMGAESETLSKDVVHAFVVYTETLLSKSPDPRSPKTSQFVDLTGVSLRDGLQPGVLKKLYATFEPNYPETLEKMVLYPVPRIMVKVVAAMLSFVNEHTRKKFIITDDLELVCSQLGWDMKEIETCGSVNGYMKKHLKHGLSFVFD